MDTAALTVRAGRTWRHNPAFRSALAGRRDPAEASVLDVLHVVVDGVDLTAGVREDRVFRVMADLARAVERLARGRLKAQVTFGRPPVELLLVRRGRAILLTLVEMGDPPALRARDVAVEAPVLFEAVADGLDEVLADVREVAPELADSGWSTRLARTLRHLRSHPAPEAQAAPASPARRAAVAPEGPAAGRITCGFTMEDDDDRLATVVDDPGGDLHSLLVPGRIAVRAADGRELAAWSAPPFLTFRTLVGQLREAVVAWEAGEPAASLGPGDAPLALELRAGTVAGPDGPAIAATAPALAAAVLPTVLDFCAAVVARAPGQRHNAWLADLAESAAEQLAHVRQLLEGDLTAARPVRPEASPVSARAPSARPLGPWRVRRLAFRYRWSFDAGPLVPGGLVPLGGRLLTVGEDGAFALDRGDGSVGWQREGTRAAWVGPRRTDPVLLAGPLGLDLVTAAGGTGWSRPLSGPLPPGQVHRYLRSEGVLVLSVDGRTVVGLRPDDGSVLWRFAPPAAHRSLPAEEGGPFVATDAGFAYGLEPRSGQVRWRVRTGLAARHPPLLVGGHVVVVGDSPDGPAAAVMSADTGARPRVHPLDLDAAGPPRVFGGEVWLPGRVAGDGAAVRVRPGAADRVRRTLLEGLARRPRLLPTRGRLFASDRRGRLGAWEADGRRAWIRDLPPARLEGHPPPALATARDLLLVAHEGTHALDPASGHELGFLHLPGAWGAIHLWVDDRLNLHLADEDGTVTACALATHLSVVR